MSNVSQSLTRLSDALAVPLKYDNGDITGSCSVHIPATPTFPEVILDLKALQIVVSEQVFVLFHVSGDLYLIASHYPATGAVSVFLLDGAKLKLSSKSAARGILAGVDSIRTMVQKLNHSLVCAFYYLGGAWKPLKL